MYHFIALLTVCIWGTTFVSTKVLLAHGLTPGGIFLMRFALAYVGMAILCHRTLKCTTWRDEALMVVAGMTGGSMYFLTENTALQYAQAAGVSLVVSLAPVATVGVAMLVSKGRMRPPRKLWVGMALALAGVSLVVGGDVSGDTATHPVLGGLLALSAALLWAVYQNIVKPLGDRYGVEVLTRKVFGYGLLTIVVYEVLAGLCVPSHGLSALWGQVELALSQPSVWGNLLFLGLVASLCCYFVWNKVVERLGSVVSANYIYLNPLTTCLFSAIFLGERLTPAMAVGGLGILVGVYIAVGSGQRKKSTPLRPSVKSD